MGFLLRFSFSDVLTKCPGRVIHYAEIKFRQNEDIIQPLAYMSIEMLPYIYKSLFCGYKQTLFLVRI